MWVIGAALAVAVVAWFTVMILGMLQFFPWGLVGLIGIAAMGILIFVVVRDRLTDEEDDYYSKNIDQ
jgi:hypothetical protein